MPDVEDEQCRRTTAVLDQRIPVVAVQFGFGLLPSPLPFHSVHNQSYDRIKTSDSIVHLYYLATLIMLFKQALGLALPLLGASLLGFLVDQAQAGQFGVKLVDRRVLSQS